ncbi:MAG: DUF4861 family protein [Balneolaceae bacterium]
MLNRLLTVFACAFLMVCPMIVCPMTVTSVQAQSDSQTDYGWYTEGDDFSPTRRVRISVANRLDIPLENQPVVVDRRSLPVQDAKERWINLVDPNLPSRPEPTIEELEASSGYLRRKETNGQAITLQLDDLDKDGVWDEIFFLTDLEAGETRDFFIYIEPYERGLFEHRVHAAIGNYGRHTVPFWESETMGWKLWYPHEVDLHGKREPMLTAYAEYSTNQSGYYMPWELGTDIMVVAQTFGAGGMCLFENPDDPEHPARASHSPTREMGLFDDTRYSYDVVFNGPLRSRIRVSTMNWDSGQGFYELEQDYTAVAHKDWSTVEVNFSKFLPRKDNIMFGAGIRQMMQEYRSVQKGGMVISMGKNLELRIPDEDIGDEGLNVSWQGLALVVSDKYNPDYVAIDNWNGNHLFRIPVTADLSYEYMIAGGWSQGEANNNEEEFIEYMETEALKYNNPPVLEIHGYESRE